MPRDLHITGLEGRPAAPAEIGAALGAAGINIDGLCGSLRAGEAHVLVGEAAAAAAGEALGRAGFAVAPGREVILRSLKRRDQPGAWGRFAGRLVEKGVGIEFHYYASDTRIVVGVDDYERGMAAIQVYGG